MKLVSGLLTPITRHRLSVNSRASQSMSKPSTPLLSSHRKASELCLSPPCTRHFRTSASQQHSRASSISSVVKISAMQSDPELLYDKPRSLNATMTQATLEATHPADHYDTPRRVLQGLNPPSTPTRYLQNGKEIRQISRDITEQKSGKCESAPISVEVEGYLLMQRKQDHRQEYVEMQPLSQTKQDKSLVVADPPEKKSIRPCSLLKTDRTDENWANQLYQNSVWLQLQVEGANETYQNPVTFRSLYPKCGGGGGGHGTLPHIHSKNNSQIHGVNLRLRRSASMPCRQVAPPFQQVFSFFFLPHVPSMHPSMHPSDLKYCQVVHSIEINHPNDISSFGEIKFMERSLEWNCRYAHRIVWILRVQFPSDVRRMK